MLYAVIDPDGFVRNLVDNVNQAVQAASHYAPFVHVESGPVSRAGLSGLGDLGALYLERPVNALRMSGIEPFSMPTMSIEEAHATLLPYFPTHKLVRGQKINGKRVFFEIPKQVQITGYSTPTKMADNLLGQNYKTAKEDESFETRADVQGLSLLPSLSYGEAAQTPGARNACVGASEACIKSCLVYSGHNTIDPYNVQIKAARTRALVQQPRAFVRMLAEAISRHQRVRKAQPYVRLNVFSDLPWELICPDLFEQFKNMSFYDYTKVENRNTPSNYDLTFSFSGVNHAQVGYELSRGRRIAVVFIPPERIPSKGRARGAGLPSHLDAAMFGGSGMIPVIDGDVSDVRPRDPGQVIVGLRWKIPMGRQEEAFAQARQSAFAVPVERVGDALIAATSARMEPLVDADDELDDAESIQEVA